MLTLETLPTTTTLAGSPEESKSVDGELPGRVEEAST